MGLAVAGGAVTSGAAASDSRTIAGRMPRPRHTRRYVDCRYGQLHVTSTAPLERETRTAVFCLPQSPRSGRDFDDFAARLATDRWVHCPDVPGFGGSDAPPAPPPMEDYSAALIEGIEAMGFGPRRPIDLIALHTGAAMAIDIARQKPALVRRLVLSGVPMFTDAQRSQLRAEIVKPRPYFEDPEFLCRTWQRDLPAVADGLSQERMLMRFTEIMRSGFNSWWGHRAVFDYPTRERLPDVSTPTLFIVFNELLGPPTREAAGLVARGTVEDMTDLPGSAFDFAGERLAAATRRYLDRELA
jgi:pimeloyl-ACP methyl ester carboxylesterase